MKSVSIFLSVLAVVVTAVLCVVGFTAAMPFLGGGENEMLDFSGGWTYTSGELTEENVNMEKADTTRPFTLSRTFEPGEEDAELCFVSKNIGFSIWADDECVYDFHPQTAAIFGFSYGKFVHSVRLPLAEETSVLRIEAEPGYHDGSAKFSMVYLDRGSEYYIYMFRRFFGSFVVCVLVTAIGLILFGAGLIYSLRLGERIQTISLGVLAILSGLWEATETLIPQMLTGNSAAFHFLNYICLMFMGAPSIYLIANLTGFPKSRITAVTNIIIGANIIGQIICTLAGIADYHTLLSLTHAVIILVVLAAIGLIVTSVKRRKIDKRKFATVVSAFLALAVCGIIDIFSYIMGNAYGAIFMIGILIFVIFLGVYEVQELLEISEQNIHAAEMQRLAHTDGLTGLENRLAFDEYEREVSGLEKGRFNIVQFDINDLKTVNDKYGHSEGDRHIRAAADTISSCFGSLGRIFRTGGDEFIAILANEDGGRSFEAALKAFADRTEAYNAGNRPPVPLCIATGSAEFRCGEGKSLGDAEILADSLMYDDKKRLKAQRAAV